MKNGIEVKMGKGRKLVVLSYAVIVNGVEQVSHATTATLRKQGHDLNGLIARERKNTGLSII